MCSIWTGEWRFSGVIVIFCLSPTEKRIAKLYFVSGIASKLQTRHLAAIVRQMRLSLCRGARRGANRLRATEAEGVINGAAAQIKTKDLAFMRELPSNSCYLPDGFLFLPNQNSKSENIRARTLIFFKCFNFKANT